MLSELQLIDGTVHEGIFHTMKVDGNDTHVVLKYAKVVKDPTVTAEDLQVGSRPHNHRHLAQQLGRPHHAVPATQQQLNCMQCSVNAPPPAFQPDTVLYLQGIAKKPEQVKIFHSDDVAGIVAKDVRMSPEDLGAEQYDVGFETDAAISRGRGG